MNKKTDSFFSKDYKLRYSQLLWYLLIFLLVYRLFILLTTTKDQTGISFFTPSQIILAFSVIEIVLIVLFIIKIPKSIPYQNFFTFCLAINALLLTLYAEQDFIPSNPIVLYPDNIVFLITQLIIILVLLSFSKSKLQNKREKFQITTLIMSIFLISILSIFTSPINSDLGNLLFLLVNICGWVLMWIFIIKSIKILQEYKWKSYIPIVISFFLVIGMYMGMSKSLGPELARTIFNTILEQLFSLTSINSTIFGINPETITILIGLLTGFSFMLVLAAAIIYGKEKRTELVIIFLIGLTGISALPLLAIIRFIALIAYLGLMAEQPNKNLV